MNDDLKKNLHPEERPDPLARTRYWLSRTTNERMAELERLRQENYGYDPTTTRLERVLEITNLVTGETQRIDYREMSQGENDDDTPT